MDLLSIFKGHVDCVMLTFFLNGNKYQLNALSTTEAFFFPRVPQAILE